MCIRLDDLFEKLSKSLEIIHRYKIDKINQNYQTLEYQKKEFNRKLEFLRCKGLLVRKCMQIPENISQERTFLKERPEKYNCSA